MWQFGTSVKNPTRRTGDGGFTKCVYCGLYYTKLGISRHWDRCHLNPNIGKIKNEHKTQPN